MPTNQVASNGRQHEQLDAPDAYLSHSEDGLTSAKDGWFQDGYRAGYLDGFAHGLKQASASSSDSAALRSDARAKTKSADHREPRLKGFPCAVCGCASYSDETHCPCCGAAKNSSAGHPENDVAHSSARG